MNLFCASTVHLTTIILRLLLFTFGDSDAVFAETFLLIHSFVCIFVCFVTYSYFICCMKKLEIHRRIALVYTIRACISTTYYLYIYYCVQCTLYTYIINTDSHTIYIYTIHIYVQYSHTRRTEPKQIDTFVNPKKLMLGLSFKCASLRFFSLCTHTHTHT